MMKGHKGHHHRAKGGEVEPKIEPKPYNAQGSEVEKEAEEKKHGGKVKRNKGGRTEEHHAEGHMAKHRLDRPGRKRGGRAGADMAPLTAAAHVKDADGHKATEGNAEEGP